MEEAFYQKSEYLHLVIHLLLKASHKDHKFIFNGEEMTIRRGQVLTGRKSLAKETNIGEQIIRDCIRSLIASNFITIKKTNKFSVITIQKYDNYQNSTTNLTTKITSKEPANNHQVTTYNTLDNEKNEKKRQVFTPPSQVEVSEYCNQNNLTFDPIAFFDYYTANGWVQGAGKKIKDWKACCRTWQRNQGKFNGIVKQTPKRESDAEHWERIEREERESKGNQI